MYQRSHEVVLSLDHGPPTHAPDYNIEAEKFCKEDHPCIVAANSKTDITRSTRNTLELDASGGPLLKHICSQVLASFSISKDVKE